MPTYAVDGDRSTFGFAAKAWSLAWIRGRFSRVAGTIVVRDGRFDATGTAEASSVNTGLSPRDLHLRARDYLAVRRHPTVLLTLRDGPVSGGPASASLTVRDVTIPISVILDPLEIRDHECHIHASGQFDRNAVATHGSRSTRTHRTGNHREPSANWLTTIGLGRRQSPVFGDEQVRSRHGRVETHIGGGARVGQASVLTASVPRGGGRAPGLAGVVLLPGREREGRAAEPRGGVLRDHHRPSDPPWTV